MIVFFVGLLGLSVKNYYYEVRKEESFFNPLALLMLSIMIEFSAVMFKLIDLFVYSFDGEGTLFLRAMTNISNTLS